MDQLTYVHFNNEKLRWILFTSSVFSTFSPPTSFLFNVGYTLYVNYHEKCENVKKMWNVNSVWDNSPCSKTVFVTDLSTGQFFDMTSDLSTEQFFDVTLKEFVMWCEKSVKIQENYE